MSSRSILLEVKDCAVYADGVKQLHQIEVPVGDIIKYKNKSYMCIKSKTCTECPFLNCKECEFVCCGGSIRNDKTYVSFLEVKPDDNQSDKPFNQNFFNGIANEFDEHVRNSIPLYDEYFDYISRLIPSIAGGKTVLDLCGSTGLLGQRIRENGFKGSYINLDGSPEMINISRSRFNLNFERNYSVLGGFMASWEDNGVDIPEVDIASLKPYVVVENLGFQFFTKTRKKELEAIKEAIGYGFFITFEKTKTNDKVFEQQEIIKDHLHKSKSFNSEEIQAKKESVLAPMGDYLYDDEEYYSLLKKTFKNVKCIANIGNFVGYICSDSDLTGAIAKSNVELNIELLDNIYTII